MDASVSAVELGPDLEGELLQSLGKPNLASVKYFDLHVFCADRDWTTEPKELFDHWLAIHSETEGRESLIAQYTRNRDYGLYDSAMRELKERKCPERLIAVLEDIVANRGNYHCTEVVKSASKFLAELQRRYQVKPKETTHENPN